ncbi:MAG: cytochrome c biogenesis protein CcsA [Candidatus Kariarchaeaceae archaeon]|jgi:cytochrome c biogenesis factor
MVLQPILSILLYLTALVAVVSGMLFSKQLIKGDTAEDTRKLIRRLIYLITLLLSISQISLAVIMVNVRTDFEMVINSAASWMSTWELIGASWTSRWGSYHLWTWFTWLLTSFFFKKYHTQSADQQKKDQFLQIVLWGSIVVLLLLIGQRPYRSVEGSTIPIGLNPSLLSLWNYLHPPLAFASYAGFFISWAIASYIWHYNVGMKSQFVEELLQIDRIITRVTWILTSLVLVFGMLWSHEATWGGYWSWDAVQVVAVLLWLISGYRLHLHEVGRNQALYLLLGILGFPMVFFAAWLITGNILEGLHNYANSPVAPLFLVLMIITLLPVISGWIKHKWNPLSPVRVSGDVAKPTGFNLGVMGFNFLLLGNFSIIALEIIDTIIDINREFSAVYPIINGIGFLAVILGLLVDSVQHKNITILQLIILSLVSASFLYILQRDYPIDHDLGGTTKLLLIWIIICTIVTLLVESVNKFRIGKKIKGKRLTSHIAMLLILITIIANGSGAAEHTREQYFVQMNEVVETKIPNISIQLVVASNSSTDRGIITTVHLVLFDGSKAYHREINVINQIGYQQYIESTWVILSSGLEIFLTLERPFSLQQNQINGINLIIEQYYLTQPLLASIVLFFVLLIPVNYIFRRNPSTS